MDENEAYDKMRFWKKLAPEAQEENFDVLLDLIKNFKDQEYYLLTLFINSDSRVLKNHNLELADLMRENKAEIAMAEAIWKSLDKEFQKNNIDIFESIMESKLSMDSDISSVWKETTPEIQEHMLEEGDILSKCGNDPEKKMQILRGLHIKLSEENFKLFLDENKIDVPNIEEAYKTYSETFKVNKEINTSVDLRMFGQEDILSIFSVEKLARITSYPNLQDKMIEVLNSTKNFSEVLKAVDDENWVMELDGILKNVEQYPELLESIKNSEVDEKSSKMIIQVLSQSQNCFNIKSIEDATNYFDIRKDTCLKILNDEEPENLSPEIKEKYSGEDLKKFAVLELMYGIDIEEAQNLTQKYGTDIEKIDFSKYGKTAIKILGIKRILECENISQKYNENKSIIDNELENIDYENVASLEADCIDMYSKMYNEALYSPKEEDKNEQVEYEGKKIDVYEIKEDFSMFVRAEGACNGYEEPENFESKISNPSTKYHGNCKSYIRQDMLGMANAKGVIFGYSKSNNGSMLLSAPWDIMSNGANTEFSTASEKWNLNCGIQFRTPDEMINATRHSYNEFDYEKLMYDEETKQFTGDRPSYIVYIKEPSEANRDEDDKWRVSKKAASQLGLPIVVIDREKILEKEWERFNNLQDMLLGNTENKNNIPETDLIESMITKFENNSNGIRGNEALANKYFTPEQRNAMIKGIVGKIKSFENEDYEKYQLTFNKLLEVVRGENSKTVSNTNQNVGQIIYGGKFLESLEKKCKEIGNPKGILKQKYQEFGIEEQDVRSSRVFLNERDRNLEEEQK